MLKKYRRANARVGQAIGAACEPLECRRLLAIPGDIDPTFSGDGMQTIDVNGIDQGTAVAVQSDEKTIVVGSTLESTYQFGVARLNIDGSLDATFDGDGR